MRRTAGVFRVVICVCCTLPLAGCFSITSSVWQAASAREFEPIRHVGRRQNDPRHLIVGYALDGQTKWYELGLTPADSFLMPSGDYTARVNFHDKRVLEQSARTINAATSRRLREPPAGTQWFQLKFLEEHYDTAVFDYQGVAPESAIEYRSENESTKPMAEFVLLVPRAPAGALTGRKLRAAALTPFVMVGETALVVVSIPYVAGLVVISLAQYAVE